MKNMFSRLVKFVPLSRIIPVVIIFLFSHTTNIYASYYYAAFTARVEPESTGMGTVYASKTDKDTDGTYDDESRAETTSQAPEQSAWLFAQSADGYYFLNWKKMGEQSVYSTSPTAVEVSVDATSSKDKSENRVDGGTYLAYFTPVLVNSGKNATAPISVSDIYVTTNSLTDLHTNTGTVTFAVTGADAPADFYDPEVTGTGFSYKSMTYANNTITVTVQYQDQNIDNVNGDAKPTLQATVTLQSKGDTNGTLKKTATITATSSLKPNFTINPSEGKTFIDLTPSTPMENDAIISTTLAKVLDASASTTTAINVAPNNNVANAGVWSIAFKDASDAAAKGYSISADAQTVSFSPTDAYKNKVDVTTILRITCTYTDASGKQISQAKEITISADAGKIITIQNESDGLMVANAMMTIDVAHGTSGTMTTETTAFLTTLNNITQIPSSGFPSEYITYDLIDNNKVSISVKNTFPIGQHKHSITYSSDGVTAVLNLIVNVRLEKPVVTATAGIGQSILLTWEEIFGATSYVIKSGTTTIATISENPLSTSYVVTTINGQTLKTGKEYPFTVTAVCASNSFGNNTSDEVKATPSLPISITSTNVSSFALYTGTEKSGSFPYKDKTLIDLIHTFDASGNALFDYLYVFGITTNTTGGIEINTPSKTKACNATTPCYVYKKNTSGTGYDFVEEFDAVAKRFDHNTNMNSKKLYFTGYCPFAYMGTTLSEEGWMYFKGGKNAQVDLYLENCEIQARYKTPTGINSGYTDKLLISVGNNYFTGFSSVFVFSSTSTDENNPYKPTIHIRGNNHLKGQIGQIKDVNLDLIITEQEFIHNVPIISAPITIKPDKNNGFTHLTMDDLWPTNVSTKESTNGYIRLDTHKVGSEKAERGPSIDLGSKYGSLTINGGQYYLRNGSADNNYTSNMAISYRTYSKSVSVLSATLYGYGDDQTDCKLFINSGTFSMYKNMLTNDKGVYLGASFYHDQDKFMDLRLPAGNGNSRINGGTFNGISNVLMCSSAKTSGASPKNAGGLWLCLRDIPITGTNPNGSAIFTIPSNYIEDGAYENVTPVYDLAVTENMDKVSNASLYGGQSVNAVDGKVRLLLPGESCTGDCEDCEEIIEALYYNWVVALPTISMKVKGTPMPMGGPVKVPENDGTGIEKKINQLLYTDLDGLGGYTSMVQDVAEISIEDADYPRGQFTNEEKYTIEKNLNLVKVVEADRWYCFVAPFDIHEVQVIEIGENVVKNQPNRDAAKKAQAEKNLSVWETLYFAIYPDDNGYAPSRTFEDAMPSAATFYKLKHYNGTAAADNNYGTNLYNANYYLYELENDEFTTNGTREELDIKWKPVRREGDAGQALMKKGKTYAIQFPWCPMCDDLATRDYYDYWTNKYIYFYGKGPQDVQGSNYQSTILATAPDPGYATLVGNSTLADMALAAEAGYVHNTTNDFFEKNNSEVPIKPTQGYMLYGGGAKGMPARISRSGQMVYPDNTTTDVEDVPTIGDRTSIMLFDAMDGFEVLSLCEQMVMVYNLQGNLIFRQQMAEGEQVHIAAAEGIYVVKGEKEAIKVMVD